MLAFLWKFLPSQSIIEGIGNELLFVVCLAGLCLFLILAWMSTAVSWELFPVRITLVRPNHVQRFVETQTNTASEGAQHVEVSSDVPNSDEASPEDQSDSSSEEAVEAESDIITGRSGTLEEQEQYAVRFRSKGHVVIRLQYVNDQARYVHAAPSMFISRFKKKHFSDELTQQHKQVRLIFQGRELFEREPARSSVSPSMQKWLRLCDYNIQDGSVIHCLVTSVTSNAPAQGASRVTDRNATQNYSVVTEFDLGTRLMEPLFASLLAFTWFFRIAYRQYFNSVSTFALIALSVFFCGAVLAVNFMNATSALTAFAFRRRRSQPDQTSSTQPTTSPIAVSESAGDVRLLTVTMVTRSIHHERHSRNSDEPVDLTPPNAPVATTQVESPGDPI